MKAGQAQPNLGNGRQTQHPGRRPCSQSRLKEGPWQDGGLEEKQLPTTTWGLEGSAVGDRTGEQRPGTAAYSDVR